MDKKVVRKKASSKTLMELALICPCGEKAKVFERNKKGYMAHCLSCGAITFFDNPQLLERIRFGGKLCPHQLEEKPCRGGHTTWCSLCRIRTFYYHS
jgi:transcription elongation factor Elf1